MRRPGLPLFLKRQPYRRRRAMDAARLLPVLGAFLFLLPMLWAPAPSSMVEPRAGRSTAADGIYLFLAWGLLIGLAALLGPRLIAAEQAQRRAEEQPKRDEDGA